MFEFLLQRHIPDWAWRQYREGSLDHVRCEALEGHLLLCPVCQTQLEDLLPQPAPLNQILLHPPALHAPATCRRTLHS